MLADVLLRFFQPMFQLIQLSNCWLRCIFPKYICALCCCFAVMSFIFKLIGGLTWQHNSLLFPSGLIQPVPSRPRSSLFLWCSSCNLCHQCPIPQYIKLLTTFIIFATNFFLESVQKVNAPILFSITGIQWLMATAETIHVQSAKTYRCRHDNSTILKYRDIFLKYHQRHGRLSHLEILCLQEITWLRFMLHPWQIRNYGIWFCLLSVLWA